MGETSFGIRAAVQVIERSVALEGALRSRTEGLTWMVWGLVAAGYLLTFENLMFRHEAAGYQSPYTGWTMWAVLPWLAAGMALTFALWRSAALQSGERYGLKGHVARAALAAVVVVLSVAASTWVLVVLLGRLTSEPLFLGLGAAWTALAVVDPWKASPLGRQVAVVSGLLLLFAGVVINGALAVAVPPFLEYRAFSAFQHVLLPVEAVVLAVVLFGAGLYQVLRG